MGREARGNAGRHRGRAPRAGGRGGEDGRVCITVADNGHGFAFHGHYDHSTLTSLQLGPVLLKQRVESLGGMLEIDSTSDGAHLDRKSTRLNSSHLVISYAVFCLKKKKKTHNNPN